MRMLPYYSIYDIAVVDAEKRVVAELDGAAGAVPNKLEEAGFVFVRNQRPARFV